MSAPYTLHVDPFAEAGDAQALERATLVRDGFHWGAFLVPMLWFFRHGHLWLGLGAFAVVAGLAGLLWAAGAGAGTILLAEFVLHVLIGLEGASLRRWAYARRGRPVADVVVAGNQTDAEVKAFGRWLAEAAPSPSAQPRSASFFGPRDPEPVIGLFPDHEGRRR